MVINRAIFYNRPTLPYAQMKQRTATSDDRFSAVKIHKIGPNIFTLKAMTYRHLLQYCSILLKKNLTSHLYFTLKKQFLVSHFHCNSAITYSLACYLFIYI
jgi:hypothetical protein